MADPNLLRAELHAAGYPVIGAALVNAGADIALVFAMPDGSARNLFAPTADATRADFERQFQHAARAWEGPARAGFNRETESHSGYRGADTTWPDDLRNKGVGGG